MSVNNNYTGEDCVMEVKKKYYGSNKYNRINI